MRGVLTGICVLAMAAPQPSQAQSRQGPEILVLGTYHMANPGRDIHNLEVDDVLSDTRQREIQELVQVLRRFRPTKVAVEASVKSRTIADRYAAYVRGDYTLSRNEIDQIGLRMAKEQGHPTVYSVDEDGDFPYYRVLNYAKANGREAEFDSTVVAPGARRVDALGAFMRSHTVLETMELVNADSSVAEDVGSYFAFVPFGEPWEYAGPDLIARWFERNLRIYHNIRALIESPDERILVIYGLGHLGWLQNLVASDPTTRLRKLSDFVESR